MFLMKTKNNGLALSVFLLMCDPVFFFLARFKSRTSCLNCWKFYYQQNVASKYWPFWCNAIYWPRPRFSVRIYFCVYFVLAFLVSVLYEWWHLKYITIKIVPHPKKESSENSCVISCFFSPLPRFQLLTLCLCCLATPLKIPFLQFCHLLKALVPTPSSHTHLPQALFPNFCAPSLYKSTHSTVFTFQSPYLRTWSFSLYHHFEGIPLEVAWGFSFTDWENRRH